MSMKDANRLSIMFKERETHFARVLRDLEIELICANSPQAKGRVERANGILQDRFIKEMRIQKISTIEEANNLGSKNLIFRFSLEGGFTTPKTPPKGDILTLV